MEKAKNPSTGNRGGGRKPTGLRRVLFTVSCQPEQRDEVRRLAKAAGKSVSAFLLEAVLKPADS